MGICRLCRKESSLIPGALELCLDCIRGRPEEARQIALGVHARIRGKWGLPPEAPRHAEGIPCDLCVNRCRIGEGELGYCGLRRNVNGRMQGVSSFRGKLSWYHDPLPTNCVGDWVCPGGSGCGYPAYSYSKGPEYGYDNLAVFPHACTFHCLYCQNWYFRYHTLDDNFEPLERLADAVNKKTACICYFGGDPPLLIASTLMVPGYIDGREVEHIARFIASLDPEIPYSLLAFHPEYRMTDLAATSREQARECLDAARQAGLRRVRGGNMHLLW